MTIEIIIGAVIGFVVAQIVFWKWLAPFCKRHPDKWWGIDVRPRINIDGVYTEMVHCEICDWQGTLGETEPYSCDDYSATYGACPRCGFLAQELSKMMQEIKGGLKI